MQKANEDSKTKPETNFGRQTHQLPAAQHEVIEVKVQVKHLSACFVLLAFLSDRSDLRSGHGKKINKLDKFTFPFER